MKFFVTLFNWGQNVLDFLRGLDFIGPLAIRLFLAPIFWVSGTKKLAEMDKTIEWFGNAETGLGLPYPEILAWTAALTETIGAILLLVGFATRWISIPLMITVGTAIFTVHLPKAWEAMSSAAGSVGSEQVIGTAERLGAAKSLLMEHGQYSLSNSGNFIMQNNGIEFAGAYFIMLLVLFFIGAGKFFSLDYYFDRALRRPYKEKRARIKAAKRSPEKPSTSETKTA